jgi:competence protein ComEA helix-hairpin-helix repeat region
MKKRFRLLTAIFLLISFLWGCGNPFEDDKEINVIRAEDISSSEEHEVKEQNKPLNDGKNSSEELTTDSQSLCVYICGAVEAEDVYQVPPGSRVNDVLKLAGGFSEDAATRYVNLAEEVRDGERIYIPYEDELDIDMVKGIMDDDSHASPDNEADGEKLVNINTAGKEELMTLPGIGETRAEDIIRYREQNGEFEKVDDIMNVNGIKEGTFNKLKDKITI